MILKLELLAMSRISLFEYLKENSKIKEPELFENSYSEDDLEIPAFLRRQKN